VIAGVAVIAFLPLGLAVVMPLLLGVMLWAVVTGRLPAKAWLLVFVLQGVLLGAAALALRTGEQDEDRIEARAGEPAIEAHERAAQAFTVAAGGTLIAAALAWVLRKRRVPFLFAGASSVALSVGMLVLALQAGSRGGALVHGGAGVGVARGGEVRPGNDPVRPGEGRSGEDDDDDDD
jgi:hypothetical protein